MLLVPALHVSGAATCSGCEWNVDKAWDSCVAHVAPHMLCEMRVGAVRAVTLGSGVWDLYNQIAA